MQGREQSELQVEELPTFEVLYATSEVFKVFGDPTRLRILYALFNGEKCVNDIALGVGMSCSAVSHQLKVLRQASFVGFRRDGKMISYFLKDQHVRIMLGQARELTR